MPLREFNMERVTDRILDFCQTQGISKSILVAHSLGALIALRLAAKAPHLFGRIILVDGTLGRAIGLVKRPLGGFKHPRLAFAVAAQFFGGLFPIRRRSARLIGGSKILRQLLLWPYVARPRNLKVDVITRALSHNGGLTVAKVATEARHFVYEDLLRAIPHSVDLIWGNNDRLISIEDIGQVRNLVNVERELCISTCGHWPMIEEPNELAHFILSWREHDVNRPT
jgi:pimeloyl-ACP methyl ester carboxylesterase